MSAAAASVSMIVVVFGLLLSLPRPDVCPCVFHAGFIDDKARFPRRLITLCIDGVCILIGALLGTSPLTVVAESSVGIKEGGRTGRCLLLRPRPAAAPGHPPRILLMRRNSAQGLAGWVLDACSRHQQTTLMVVCDALPLVQVSLRLCWAAASSWPCSSHPCSLPFLATPPDPP